MENDRTLTLDQVEASIACLPQADCPVTHRFTPGLYIREVRVPAGTLLTSMTHKTEHPFILSQGSARVVTEMDGEQLIEAPFTGITKPATRRILYAESDLIWTTFHATEETDLEKICIELLEPHQNNLLEDKSLLNYLKSIPNSKCHS